MKKTDKPAKTKKAQKMVTAKKLPGLLKKSYTKKALDKKIYKKIYIDADRNLLESLFKDDPKSKGAKEKKYCIPLDTQLTKEQARHLKAVAKDIKAQKGRIKIVSFAAVAAVIVAIGVTVTVFKNPVAKWAIRSAMQGAFGAKCDIGRVDVEIFGASIEVDNLAQANKDEPMKNIFQLDKVLLDFNLTQALRGRFDAQNLEITGVALGTDRKTSGALPAKAKKEKKEESNDESGFVKALKERSELALTNAKNTFGSSVVDVSSPEAALESAKSKFKSPAAAKDVETKMTALLPAWKDRSAKVESDVKTFKSSAEKLSKLNVSSLKTPAEIQAALEQVNSALKDGDAAKKSVEDAKNSLKTDTETVNGLKKELDDAVEADKDTISSAIGEAKSLASGGGKKVLGNYIDSAVCTMLGKYYPYYRKAVKYAAGMKNSNSTKTTKTKKVVKKQARRLYGRDITWRKDTIPSFLIEHALATGTGFKAEAKNISNDMDKRGKPMTADGSFSVKDQLHKASLIVDARSTSTDPLITADYSGTNYPVALDLTKSISANGVPSFNGTTTVSAHATAESDFSFAVNANMDLNPITISAASFSPETISSLYQKALAQITSMNIGGTVGFAPDKGVDLSLSTDADKKIIAAVSSVASGALSEAQEKAKAKALAELNSQTSGASDKIAQFTGIQTNLDSSSSSVSSMNSSLDAKKKELQNALTNQAKSKASSAGKDAAASALKKLF